MQDRYQNRKKTQEQDWDAALPIGIKTITSLCFAFTLAIHIYVQLLCGSGA